MELGHMKGYDHEPISKTWFVAREKALSICSQKSCKNTITEYKKIGYLPKPS